MIVINNKVNDCGILSLMVDFVRIMQVLIFEGRLDQKLMMMKDDLKNQRNSYNQKIQIIGL